LFEPDTGFPHTESCSPTWRYGPVGIRRCLSPDASNSGYRDKGQTDLFLEYQDLQVNGSHGLTINPIFWMVNRRTKHGLNHSLIGLQMLTGV
jgi:hypothetical protein